MTLAEVHEAHPRWHAWADTSGHCWAATCHCHTEPGTGTTLEAATPDLLADLITAHEAEYGEVSR